MPKMSLNPELAKQGGGGVEAGKYRIVAAKNRNIKTDNSPCRLALDIDLAQLDANWQPVRDAENQSIWLFYGTESLKHYRPGVAKDANDPDPVAQSDAPDAEGNTVVPLDAEPFNKAVAAMVFLESLRKQGFPADILNRGYAPDLVGLEFELASYSPKECNDKFGTRLNTKPMKDAKDPNKTVDITYKVAIKWNNPNYLGGATAASSAGTSTAVATGSSSVPTTTESAEELTTKVLKVVADRKKGSEIKSKQALFGFVTNEYTKHSPKLPPAKLSEVQSIINNRLDFVAQAFAELGVTAEYDDNGNPTGKFVVPA